MDVGAFINLDKKEYQSLLENEFRAVQGLFGIRFMKNEAPLELNRELYNYKFDVGWELCTWIKHDDDEEVGYPWLEMREDATARCNTYCHTDIITLANGKKDYDHVRLKKSKWRGQKKKLLNDLCRVQYEKITDFVAMWNRYAGQEDIVALYVRLEWDDEIPKSCVNLVPDKNSSNCWVLYCRIDNNENC